MDWISKRSSRLTKRRSSLLVGAAIMLAAALLLTQAPALARGGQPAGSLVERLERLERHVDEASERSAILHEAIAAAERTLRKDAASLGTASRAQRRVKRKLAGQLVAWERTHRRLDRAQRYLPPGAAADTRVLLGRAQPAALRSRMDDIGVLQTIAADVRRTRRLVSERAFLAVELAQSEGDTDAAEASKDKVIEQAKSPDKQDQVDRELEAADRALESSLGMMLKNETSRDFHRLKGTLLPPVDKPVTFGFGPRKQRHSMSYVRHSGWTWTLPAKTPVKAVGGGLVVFSGRFEGFGKVVIVDHGQDYHSLYAHLGSLDVEVGARLKRGAVLGKSGATGSFEGPKLYFELRKNGQPLDPKPWFIQR